MKKIISILTAMIIVCSLLTFTTSAAVPTELNIYKTKTAPNMSDSGKIDAVYGEKVFDIRASELAKDDQNLFPNKQRDPHMLEDKGVKEAMKVMHNIGYMTYDDKNLYIACDVTDVAPKAASNSAEPWKSTNLQLVMFVNEELSFITVAYEGTNKVGVVNDRRSVMDYELVEATFFEKSKTNYVYEIKIPWEAFPEVSKADDVWYFRMGVVQSSMANGYVCAAFGEAYFLQAPKCVPVNLKGLKTDSASKDESNKDDNKNNTSSSNKNDDKNNTSSSNKNDDKNNTSSNNKVDNTTSNNNDKNNNTSDNKGNATDKTESQNNNAANNTSSNITNSGNSSSATNNSDKNDKPADTEVSSDKNESSADKQEDVGPSGEGTDLDLGETENSGETMEETTTETTGESTTTVVEENAEKDWTPIIIIGIVAVVIIAGGAVAIVLLNKKPKENK